MILKYYTYSNAEQIIIYFCLIVQVTAQHSTSHHFPQTQPVDDYYNMLLLIPQLGVLSASPIYQQGLCHFLILISRLLTAASDDHILGCKK